MRTLPINFTKYGQDFTLVRRTSAKAMYSRNGGETYEVIRIRHSPQREIGNRVIDAGEYYPSAEKWGTEGWTYTKFTHALKKYDEL